MPLPFNKIRITFVALFPERMLEKKKSKKDEKDFPTVEKKTGQQTWISRSHEQQERSQDACPPPRQRPCAAYRFG